MSGLELPKGDDDHSPPSFVQVRTCGIRPPLGMLCCEIQRGRTISLAFMFGINDRSLQSIGMSEWCLEPTDADDS